MGCSTAEAVLFQKPQAGMTIWTIGHSTRTLDELMAALTAQGIQALADVRSFPSSARYLHFNRENLARVLPTAGRGSSAGLSYDWLGRELGGYRKQGRGDSPHTALRSPGFRHYADHMETDTFRQGIAKLLALAEEQPTAYMCAERLWWRCHRSLISDYLQAVRGVEVVHILDEGKTEPHRMHRAARLAPPPAGQAAGRLVYDLGESAKLL
jgi:uncharacterized protein (DUF488 family)